MNIFLPVSCTAVNNTISLLSCSSYCSVDVCFLLWRHHLKPDVTHRPLLWSLQASEDPFSRNRKHFIARVTTPLIQPHESGRAHPGETQESSGPINKVWKDIQAKRRGQDFSLSLSEHMSQMERDAHLSSSSRETLLHTRPREAHLKTTTAASNSRLHSQERTTTWAAIEKTANSHRPL